ncbi:hypothetical protein ACFFWD_35690 [Bradyrhizobium erythrophlei]|uniref:hypothetical protein n=1 Tax=Bradyrhizobium erythrophlei TaxID=1437360 RepID=UPI0035EC7AB5
MSKEVKRFREEADKAGEFPGPPLIQRRSLGKRIALVRIKSNEATRFVAIPIG